jgi:hypothetical protein
VFRRLDGRLLVYRRARLHVADVGMKNSLLVERVDVLQAGETLEDLGELLGEGLLGELDLTGVEATDTADLEAAADLLD